ncbi:MAG: hypothetical protein KUG74_06775 [Rhodobacteraceae bacterium]|nr:hypothetical protein [Paracoccaceae bacterium]
MRISVLAAAVFGSMLIGSTTVSGATYSCKINSLDKIGWVPETVFFTEEKGADTVHTLDNVTFAIGKKTAMAKVLVNNAKRITFKWRTPRYVNREQQNIIFSIKATYLRPKKLLILYVKPEGYHNDGTGRGPCVEVKKDLNKIWK